MTAGRPSRQHQRQGRPSRTPHTHAPSTHASMDDGERYIQVQYLAQPSALLRKNPATCQTATSVPSEHVTAICGCGCGLGDHVHTPQTILLLDMLQQCWWWCSMWINARCRGLLARAHYRVPSCSFRLGGSSSSWTYCGLAHSTVPSVGHRRSDTSWGALHTSRVVNLHRLAPDGKLSRLITHS